MVVGRTAEFQSIGRAFLLGKRGPLVARRWARFERENRRFRWGQKPRVLSKPEITNLLRFFGEWEIDETFAASHMLWPFADSTTTGCGQ